MGLSGKFGSNGFTYAMPLPMIVRLGVNNVLFSHKVNETTLVFPGSMCTDEEEEKVDEGKEVTSMQTKHKVPQK